MKKIIIFILIFTIFLNHPFSTGDSKAYAEDELTIDGLISISIDNYLDARLQSGLNDAKVVDKSTFLPYDEPLIYIEDIIDGYHIEGIVKYNNPVEIKIKDEDGNLITNTPKFYYPNTYISRAQLCQMVCGALDLNSQFPVEIPFSDVDNDYWAADYIYSQLSKGIMNGYPDGTFKPDGNVSRAEIALYIYRTFDIPKYLADEPIFSDVPDWAREAVESLYNADIINGDEDGCFYPDKLVYKSEATALFIKAMGLKDELTDVQYFDDLYDHWASRCINTGFEHGLYNFYNEDTFQVNVDITGSVIIEATDNNCTISEKIITLNNIGFDINNDNNIDLNDLTYLSQYYADKVDSQNQKYDLNNDSIVNIYDLVIIARQIGQ